MSQSRSPSAATERSGSKPASTRDNLHVVLVQHLVDARRQFRQAKPQTLVARTGNHPGIDNLHRIIIVIDAEHAVARLPQAGVNPANHTNTVGQGLSPLAPMRAIRAILQADVRAAKRSRIRSARANCLSDLA